MATIFPTSIPTKSLSASITASASTFQLSDILGWSGSALTSADFGTLAYGIFRNANSTQVELFEFDPSTIASSSITITRRGLNYTGDLTTESSTRKYSWTKGTLVELGSHVPQLLKHFVTDVGDQTIAGVKTFSSLPTIPLTPVATTDAASKAYVDLTATGSATTNKVTIPGTAGETVAAGNLVYLKSSDSRWWLCDADTASIVDSVILGIAQGSGTAGNTITGGVLLKGIDTNQSGLTADTVYYASNTAGGISSTPGTTEVTVGVALTTTTLIFEPRYNQALTEDQQDALVGNNGTPSATNLFITQTGFQRGQEIYAADSVGTDAYAVTLSPAIAAYVTGMMVLFKAGTANTGASTLAVNGLAATALKKYIVGGIADTVTGDILANQIVAAVYDSAVSAFVIISATSASVHSALFSSGTTSKNATDASTTQTIAHGLGVTPKYVRIRAVSQVMTAVGSAGFVAEATAVYNGTTQSSIATKLVAGPTVQGITSFDLNTANNDDETTGVVTFDATNISIAWTKNGNPTGTYNILWEAQA